MFYVQSILASSDFWQAYSPWQAIFCQLQTMGASSAHCQSSDEYQAYNKNLVVVEILFLCRVIVITFHLIITLRIVTHIIVGFYYLFGWGVPPYVPKISSLWIQYHWLFCNIFILDFIMIVLCHQFLRQTSISNSLHFSIFLTKIPFPLILGQCFL